MALPLNSAEYGGGPRAQRYVSAIVNVYNAHGQANLAVDIYFTRLSAPSRGGGDGGPGSVASNSAGVMPRV